MERENTMKFKVGDKVTVGNGTIDGTIKKIIINTSPNKYYVVWDGYEEDVNVYYYFYDDLRFTRSYEDFLEKIKDRMK